MGSWGSWDLLRRWAAVAAAAGEGRAWIVGCECGNSGEVCDEGFDSGKISAELGNIVGRWWGSESGSEDRMGSGRSGQGARTECVRKVDGGGIEKIEESRQAAEFLEADRFRAVLAEFVEEITNRDTPVQSSVAVRASEIVLVCRRGTRC